MHTFLGYAQLMRTTLLTAYFLAYSPVMAKEMVAAELLNFPDEAANMPVQSSAVNDHLYSKSEQFQADFFNFTEASTDSPATATQQPLIANETYETNNTTIDNPLPITSDSLMPLTEENEIDDPMAQTTSVSQLRDVQPTDWAYEALQSLLERYGVIAGYPDGTFRGNRVLTRYEFAAALNKALTQFDQLMTSSTPNGVNSEDLATLQRLQQEFATELATLQGRVDTLEARTQELEANQFSTTTQLKGEAMFVMADAFGDDIEVAPVLQEQVRIILSTSFTGEDVLLTGFLAGNSTSFDLTDDTSEGYLAHQVIGDTENDLITFALAYIFPVNEKLQVSVAAEGGRFDFFVPPVNPYLNDFDGGEGSLSAFAQVNPIFRLGGRVGFGINYKVTDSILLSGAYLAGEGFKSNEGDGFFNGDYAALTQLTWTPTEEFTLAFTYVNSYHGADRFTYGNSLPFVSFTGTNIATTLNSLSENFPVIANSYGIETSWKISPKVALSGWIGLTEARLIGYGDAEIWNYALNLVFPDLGRKGSLGGLVLGASPTLRGLDIPGAESFDRDWAYHVEAFYKYQATDRISITPGFIWLPSPNQNQDNNDIFMGILRTTFTF